MGEWHTLRCVKQVAARMNENENECDIAHKVFSRNDEYDDTKSKKGIRVKINQTYFHPVIYHPMKKILFL